MANAEPNLNPIVIEADVEDQGPLAQQIAWEESHLGNFRKIMPPPDLTKLDYYTRFYAQSNQVSIFAETAASKKREDLARKMRIQIEEKKAKQQQMTCHLSFATPSSSAQAWTSTVLALCCWKFLQAAR